MDKLAANGLGALAVRASGSVVYVADGVKGLQRYDISVATTPVKTAEVATAGTARGLALLEDFIIVADDDSGVRIFQNSRSGLGEVASLTVSGQAMGVAVSGARIYAAAGSGGVRVIQINDGLVLSDIGGVPTKDFCWGCDVSGGRLYSANDGSGVDIIDVTSSSPRLLNSIRIGGEVFGVAAINEDMCLVCNGRAGICVVDAHDSRNPTIVSRLASLGETRNARIHGDKGYVAAGFGGVAVVDLSDLRFPTVLKVIPNRNFAWEADSCGAYVYIADGSSGLIVGE